MRPDENLMVAPENITQEAAAAANGHEGSVVEIENIVVLNSEAAAGVLLANGRSVQVTDVVGCQHSARSADARQETEEEAAENVSSLDKLVVPPSADVAAEANSVQAGGDRMAKVEEMIRKLKA